MTNIAVQRQAFQSDARAWLLNEAYGGGQPVPRDSGQIDFSLFTKNTHYPNGYIPSGVALGRVTSSGRLGPYAGGATDGRETCAGHLYAAVTVPGDTATREQVAVVDCFAVVSESRLPSGHGLDAAAKADLPLIKYRA